MGYIREWDSRTAKGGLDVEEIVADTFDDWGDSPDAKDWLEIMGYEDLEKIEVISADIPHGTERVDVIVNIAFKGFYMHVEKISVKKAKDLSLNQFDRRRLKATWRTALADKRSVDDYAEMFDFTEKTRKGLKKFCGVEDYQPTDLVGKGKLDRSELSGLYDTRHHDPPIRFAFNELSEDERRAIKSDFQSKKRKIVKTVIAGDPLEVGWYIAVRARRENGDYEVLETLIEPIEETVERYCEGEVRSSPGSSFYVGQISVQGKGGTPDREKLQFKINPWPD